MLSDFRLSHIRTLANYWKPLLDKGQAAFRDLDNFTTIDAPGLAAEFKSIPSAEPVIALPSKLLEAIQAEIPNFFGAEEWEAENDFTRLCGRMKAIGAHNTGFLHHPLLGPAVARRVFSQEDIHAAGWEHLTDENALEKALQVFDGVSEPIRARREAYLGWLLTCLPFRDELAALRRELSGIVPLPRLSHPAGEDPLASETPTGVAMGRLSAFLRRWDLSRLETWELPVPTMGSFGFVAPADASGLAEAPAVQVPKTLRFTERFPVKVFLQGKPEGHLDEWFATTERGLLRQPSYAGFRWVLSIHFWRNAVLAPSYGDRFHRQVEKLDYAFAAYLVDLNVESVRKHRLWIERKLKSDQRPS